MISTTSFNFPAPTSICCSCYCVSITSQSEPPIIIVMNFMPAILHGGLASSPPPLCYHIQLRHSLLRVWNSTRAPTRLPHFSSRWKISHWKEQRFQTVYVSLNFKRMSANIQYLRWMLSKWLTILWRSWNSIIISMSKCCSAKHGRSSSS